MITRFGEKMRKLRKIYDLKQGGFGQYINITTPQISAYERGASKPTIDLLIKISNAYGCSIEDLVDIPVHEDFFCNFIVSQEEKELRYTVNSTESESFTVQGGLVPVSFSDVINTGVVFSDAPPTVAANFILLESNRSGILSLFFESIEPSLPVQSENQLLITPPLPETPSQYMEGYPLLVELYQQFNRRAWLGSAKGWPTAKRNILLLTLPSGKIIRLFISPLAYGCKLYASYNPSLESFAKAWMKLPQKEQKKYAVEYYLNYYQGKNALEASEHKKIMANKEFYDSFFGISSSDPDDED